LKTLAVMKRELQENLRNYKTVFLLMFIFGAILMALYTEVGPTANSKSVLDPFFELFAVLCPMIGILTAMDAVVGEKEKGTMELVLSKPLPRRSLLLGKFMAYVVMIVPLLVAELIAAYFWAQVSGISQYRWQLLMPPFSQWMTMVAIVTCVSLLFLAITTLISMFAPPWHRAGEIRGSINWEPHCLSSLLSPCGGKDLPYESGIAGCIYSSTA
jgi:ABC-type transport system involved in multi-copper enzyme maturation permease subunit